MDAAIALGCVFCHLGRLRPPVLPPLPRPPPHHHHHHHHSLDSFDNDSKVDAASCGSSVAAIVWHRNLGAAAAGTPVNWTTYNVSTTVASPIALAAAEYVHVSSMGGLS